MESFTLLLPNNPQIRSLEPFDNFGVDFPKVKSLNTDFSWSRLPTSWIVPLYTRRLLIGGTVVLRWEYNEVVDASDLLEVWRNGTYSNIFRLFAGYNKISEFGGLQRFYRFGLI